MTIEIRAMVRYPEDGTVNDVEDSNDHPAMPGLTPPDKKNAPFDTEWCWQLTIDADTGKILNVMGVDGSRKDWPDEVSNASTYYKVCDGFKYRIIDDANVDILPWTDWDYVPRWMCPKENGYGDYIIMDIENGVIKDWKPVKVEKKVSYEVS